MKIRLFTPKDASMCANIMKANENNMGDMYDSKSLIKASKYTKFFVSEENRKILGMIGFSDLNNGIGMLGSLCVDPNTQGKGIGSALVEKIKEYAQKNKYRKVLLLTHEKNKKMMSLAIKADFIPEGSLKRHFKDGKDVTYFSYFI